MRVGLTQPKTFSQEREKKGKEGEGNGEKNLKKRQEKRRGTREWKGIREEFGRKQEKKGKEGDNGNRK